MRDADKTKKQLIAELVELRQRLVELKASETERKQAAEKASEAKTLKELDKLRNQLLANISHELYTPLSSIKGFATMLLDYDKKLKHDEKREYLKAIDKNADRLTEIINQLLERKNLDRK